ncbi:MAG: hypothetical protein H3C62_08475 [Gemmatimonadaceae bacterium]|nr:hypothetical protein [Gemmatimonadaceae bacterium]
MTNRLRLSLLVLAAAAACSPPDRPNTDIRMWTQDFEIRAWSDVTPPVSLEPIHYTIVVRDKKTKEPIADGQGRIYATNADGITKWDGFRYGPEVGTYHATLMFPAAGDWAMGMQFRRDSTQLLQKTVEDWRQTVYVGDEYGSASDTAATAAPDTAAKAAPAPPATTKKP